MAGHADADTVNLHKAGYVQAADPGAIGAGLVWFDTSTNPVTMRIRNDTNSGWLEVGAQPTSDPDYDSGYFSVSNNGGTYAKAHGLGQKPRRVVIWYAGSADPGTGSVYRVTLVADNGGNNSRGFVRTDDTNVDVRPYGNYSYLTANTWGNWQTGYWRILAWI